MAKTSGPVLELGSGITSTPFLFWLCRSQERLFISYDNDKTWIRNIGYPIKYVSNWDNTKIDNTHWSVVLVDHQPGERRHIDALRLKDKADYIILHDSGPKEDRYYHYKKIYSSFKYRYDYKKFPPFTTVLSNFIDVGKTMK